MQTPSVIFSLIKQSLSGWQEDNATVWCAALAYYTVFSLGPLLLIVISIVGLVFSNTHLEKNLSLQLQGLIGENGANLLMNIIQNTKNPTTSITGTIVG